MFPFFEGYDEFAAESFRLDQDDAVAGGSCLGHGFGVDADGEEDDGCFFGAITKE